jgi:hypothetical protein
MTTSDTPAAGAQARPAAAAGRRRPDNLARVLSRQHGVISLCQAESLGVQMSAIRYRIRPGGPWQRIFPGIYLTVSGTATVDQLDMAAVLYAGAPSAITGLAALRRWDIRAPIVAAPDVRESDVRTVDVIVPTECFRASRDYVRIHRTARMPPLVAFQGEIPIALIPRSVVDAALAADSERDIRAIVAGVVQQGLCTPKELDAELGKIKLKNSARLRIVLAEVVAGIRSAPEGDLMDLIKRAGLPTPLYNPRLYLDRVHLATPDAWWPEVAVAVEVDSRAFHFSQQSWEQTMKRHARMAAVGIRVLHFSPRQIRTESEMVVRTIGAALEIGAPAPRVQTKAAAP